MAALVSRSGSIDYYLPSIDLINLRAQKEFVIKDTPRLQLMLNIFNLTDVLHSATTLPVRRSTAAYTSSEGVKARDCRPK